MKLLLSSDGRTAIENIGRLSGEPPAALQLVWVITAAKMEENSNFLNWDLQAFLEAGITPYIYDIQGQSRPDFEKDLSGFDVIFVEGGDVFHLLKTIRATGFDAFLNEWVRQKPYIGVSAGSCIACPSIEMATWEHPVEDTRGLKDFKGLAYVDFLLAVHYEDKYEAAIRKGLATCRYKLKTLRDGQALLVAGGNNTLIGDQQSTELE